MHREVILHPVYAQKVCSLKIANADERFRILAKKSYLFIRSLIQIFHYLRKRIKRIKEKKETSWFCEKNEYCIERIPQG